MKLKKLVSALITLLSLLSAYQFYKNIEKSTSCLELSLTSNKEESNGKMNSSRIQTRVCKTSLVNYE